MFLLFIILQVALAYGKQLFSCSIYNQDFRWGLQVGGGRDSPMGGYRGGLNSSMESPHQ